MPAVRVRSYGAAGAVTGSKHLIESVAGNILLDCGIFQGRKELRVRNWENLGFEAASVSAVVLSHAHIDHTGSLPLLVRAGFRGPIYCTPATDELVKLLLLDSAKLQEEEAAYSSGHGTSKHQPPRPLYSEADARAVFPRLRRIPRDQESEILPGVRVLPRCAGHILGSASLRVDVDGRRVTFSGDVGRFGAPILPDPAPTELGDVLLCESTYGDRDHPDVSIDEELARTINAAVPLGGPIIVPAFALGRTQALLYSLAKLERQGRIPVLPVFVDSPMAVDVTSLYQQFDYDYDDEMKQLVAARQPVLRTARTKYCRTVTESKQINYERGPRIIISASGMVTGGRILHHLRLWLDKPETTVVFVGYQGEGTRGRTIQSGAPEVKIYGGFVPIKARIVTLPGLSAHGDRRELLRWLRSCSGTPRVTRIVHGENGAAEAFAALVQSELGWPAEPAREAEVIEL